MWLLAPLASAQTDLNRCVAADGTAVYTDRPCDALEARPAPSPSSDAPSQSPSVVAVRECPRTPGALVKAVEAALAAADGNRLAELFDWRGRSRASAARVMPRLEALAASRILEVRPGHSAEGSDDAELAKEAAAAPPDRLRILHAADGLGAGEPSEFRLVRAAGCWMLAE